MTKPQLLKLNDQLSLWMEQIECLAQEFNGSGNLKDDVHQFAREYNAVGHSVEVFLKASGLHGILSNLQFEVTEVILNMKGDVVSALKKLTSSPFTITEKECPFCGYTIELAGYDGGRFICPSCKKLCRVSGSDSLSVSEFERMAYKDDEDCPDLSL